MFIESSDIYDLVYGFKDYQKESGEITSVINARRPGSRHILDVGCGTAEHHKYLKNEYLIDGLDLNAKFIESARAKNPEGSYHVADMTDFDLGKKYDVVTCLFSSIGYVKTIERLTSTLQHSHKHLTENGVAIIEPWFTPEAWYNGKLHMLTHEKEGIKICRMNN